MSDVTNEVKEQVRKQYQVAEDYAAVSLRAWNELVATTNSMAFDVALKNWNYARSLRTSIEKAIEEALHTQHSLTNEMLQVWQGYSNGVKEIVSKTLR